MPYLAFPPILAGEGLARWLLLLVIVTVVVGIFVVCYRMLREE